MLVDERFDRVYFKERVEAIFAANSREEANAIIEEFSKFWMSIPGTRGAIGKKTVNSSTYFNALFDVEESVQEEELEAGEYTEEQENKLGDLEDEQLQ
jgi:truncated hemoglobin YjbI